MLERPGQLVPEPDNVITAVPLGYANAESDERACDETRRVSVVADTLAA